jgi:hypothetical protein
MFARRSCALAIVITFLPTPLAAVEAGCKSSFLGICTERRTPEEQARADAQSAFYNRVYERYCPNSMEDRHDCLVDITARIVETQGFALAKCSSDGHPKRADPKWIECFTRELRINVIEYAEAACQNSGFLRLRDPAKWEICVRGETIEFPPDWYRLVD